MGCEPPAEDAPVDPPLDPPPTVAVPWLAAKAWSCATVPLKTSLSAFGAPGAVEVFVYCQNVQSLHALGMAGDATPQFETQSWTPAGAETPIPVQTRCDV